MNKTSDFVKDELNNLLKLLEIEQNQELEFYTNYLQKQSLHNKVTSGYTWYPVSIKDEGYGLGDYPYIVIECHSKHLEDHQFNGGKQVRLYATYDSELFVSGVVHYVNNKEMKIIFTIDELPDWVDKGRLAVDLMYDDRTHKEMVKAINVVINAKNCELSSIANKIYGVEELEPLRNIHMYVDEKLNESQNDAVTNIINTADIALVHGPPGTGKTTTLVAAIKVLAKHNNHILVCAPSNVAADFIATKLGDEGLRILRIGNLARIDDEILPYTVEGQIEKHNRYKELTDYKRKSAEYRKLAQKYKRSFGQQEREQRNLLYKEARALSTEARVLEDFLVSDILRLSQVVITTLVGVENKYLEDKIFDVAIIDEAAQALEPATWIPISKAKKVILAGDPFQLPPTVKSFEASQKGLSKTLLEKAIKTIPQATTLLNVQYRMNAAIMGFSNHVFYNNQLQASPLVIERTILSESIRDSVLYIDTAGCGFNEVQNEESLSLSNPEEVKILLQHVEDFMGEFHPDDVPSIGIISPYKEQVNVLNQAIYSNENLRDVVKANTIDAFQGQEKDVIYISLVRSNDNGEIGFLKDYRRMNVALTRARKKLIIIGDSATLGSDSFYEDFLKYIEENCTYKSAWEFIM